MSDKFKFVNNFNINHIKSTKTSFKSKFISLKFQQGQNFGFIYLVFILIC